FQAEDGIRDPLVTGVQTCALPISAATARATRSAVNPRSRWTYSWNHRGASGVAAATSSMLAEAIVDSTMTVPASEQARAVASSRSEERRVGNEAGGRGWP